MVHERGSTTARGLPLVASQTWVLAPLPATQRPSELKYAVYNQEPSMLSGDVSALPVAAL
jgi:hypothetical protein